MGFVDLLGESLQSAAGSIGTSEALAGKKAVALYFSAHWCPPCRGFTPQLAEWYSKDLKGKGLEVVFVSSDRSEEDFSGYFKEMPWLALPYADREKKEALSKKFGVRGIPSLVILDEAAMTITTEGRKAVSEDPTGEELPWKPQKVSELLSGAKIVSSEGREMGISEVMKEKAALAFYFSAHWCPPCRGFTPKLAEWYSKDLKGKGLEVVFVSADRDEQGFKDYFAEMPWFALDYSDRKLSAKLNSACGVDGIPALVVLDRDLKVITTEGREAVSADPKGEELPWHPKPVKDLSQGPGAINETKTVVVFCETQDAAQQRGIEEALRPLAERYLEKQQSSDGEAPLEFSFMMCKSPDGLSSKVRGMSGLPTLPPKPHEHPLEKKAGGGGWGCDGCGSGDGDERWRCAQGCDFDFCAECNAKVGKEQEGLSATLVLYDIPDGGAYYLAPAGVEITAAVVEKFLSDFSSGGLERKQLG